MSALTAERNIRLLIEYDGTRYVGWQQQAEHPSIQGALQHALHSILGVVPPLRVAGRTDAGVHARGQVANFRTTHPLEAARFAPALNHYLPCDISVHHAEQVAATFDAKRDSLSKRYRYRIYSGPQRAALLAQHAWHRHQRLDVSAMRRGAEHLLGERDFEAFRSVHCDAEHARRHMYAIDIQRSERPPAGEVVDIIFQANAYCRHMCRILSGTLVEVGLGKRDPNAIQHILASRDRRNAGMTAPAKGLTLLDVQYQNP